MKKEKDRFEEEFDLDEFDVGVCEEKLEVLKEDVKKLKKFKKRQKKLRELEKEKEKILKIVNKKDK